MRLRTAIYKLPNYFVFVALFADAKSCEPCLHPVLQPYSSEKHNNCSSYYSVLFVEKKSRFFLFAIVEKLRFRTWIYKLPNYFVLVALVARANSCEFCLHLVLRPYSSEKHSHWLQFVLFSFECREEVEMLSFCYYHRSWDSGLEYTNCLIILSLLPWLLADANSCEPCLHPVLRPYSSEKRNNCSLYYSVLYVEKKSRCFPRVSPACIWCCDHIPVRNNNCSLYYSVLFVERKSRCFLFAIIIEVEIQDLNIQIA